MAKKKQIQNLYYLSINKKEGISEKLIVSQIINSEENMKCVRVAQRSFMIVQQLLTQQVLRGTCQILLVLQGWEGKDDSILVKSSAVYSSQHSTGSSDLVTKK